MDFERLVNEHKNAVYRQLVRTCQSREDAEDVLIEALMRAYQQLDQLNDQGAFRAWLRQIARRICWGLKRREALAPFLQLDVVEEEGKLPAAREPLPDELAEQKELRTLLHEVVASLPEAYRVVYELRDVEDVPGDQVAAQLGLTRAAMKSRLHRARQLVRVQLDKALDETRV